MKIRGPLSTTSTGGNAKSSDNKKTSDFEGGIKFAEELKRLEGLDIQQKLNGLLEDIDRQSKKLSKNIDLRELIRYKKLISEFLNQCITNSMEFSKNNTLDRRGRHRVFATIKQVNEKLDHLTKDMLSEEKENIDILKTIDDIRGLLLDLYM